MKQCQHRLNISATGRGFYNITREIQAWLSETGIQTGMFNVFVQHTSCSLSTKTRIYKLHRKMPIPMYCVIWKCLCRAWWWMETLNFCTGMRAMMYG